MEEKQLNIYQKLAQVRRIADAVKKDKRGFNYTYADLTAILAKVTAGMDRYGLSLLPGIVPRTANVQTVTSTNTKTDKTGRSYEQITTEMLVTADMVFTWVNNERPEERIEVPWFLTGSQTDPSQAFGSGLTYCTRYFLTDYFQIAQSDLDVDAYRSKQREAVAAEDKAIAASIINTFDGKLKQYLAEHPEKKDEIVKFISARYVKDANYLKIVDPELAGRLLKDFEDTYMTD